MSRGYSFRTVIVTAMIPQSSNAGNVSYDLRASLPMHWPASHCPLVLLTLRVIWVSFCPSKCRCRCTPQRDPHEHTHNTCSPHQSHMHHMYHPNVTIAIQGRQLLLFTPEHAPVCSLRAATAGTTAMHAASASSSMAQAIALPCLEM